jgi:hypothetical protein
MALSNPNLAATMPLPPSRQGPLPIRHLLATHLSVLCINCQETIDLVFVEAHSSICTRLSDEVQAAEASEDPLKALYLRISKLRQFLQQLVEGDSLKPGERNYLTMGMRHLQQLAEVPTIGETREVLSALSSLLVTFKGSDSILVFLERIRALALEQEKGLNMLEIALKRAEIHELQSQLNTEKRKLAIWQESLAKVHLAPRVQITSVQSQVSSIEASECSTPASADEDVPTSEEPKMSENTSDPEELKRLFIAKALVMKLSNRRFDQQQFISLSELHAKAISLKLPIASWPEFIQTELLNPTNWFPKNNPTKRFSSRPLSSQFAYFDTITEEEAEGRASMSPSK